MRRTTETVLRQEIAAAERELESRTKRLLDAKDDLVEAERRAREWADAVDQSRGRLRRAEASLGVFLGEPNPPDETVNLGSFAGVLPTDEIIREPEAQS